MEKRAGNANAIFPAYCTLLVIFTGNESLSWVEDGLMFTGMIVAASFLFTGLIAFTYLKNG
ncbi:MAG: hypothetical protein JWO94_471 [Verrucomicrobiaceae bacterium]|nr:hypothetical protein [Verrucomicrobiaceae bacterium]